MNNFILPCYFIVSEEKSRRNYHHGKVLPFWAKLEDSGNKVRETLTGNKVKETLTGNKVKETLTGNKVKEILTGNKVRKTLTGSKLRKR
jgi:hypothetical protein